MLIKSQDSKNIYNISQAYRLYVNDVGRCGYTVVAEFLNGGSIILGTYKDEYTAREELKEIYTDIPYMGYHTMEK